MSLLGLGAWLMYGVLGIADSAQSSAINSESKERAIKEGRVTYMDAKGNERMVSTGQVVMRWTENGETILIDPKTMKTVYNITAMEKRKELEEAPHYYDRLNQKSIEFAKENGYVCAHQKFKVPKPDGKFEHVFITRDLKNGQLFRFDSKTRYFPEIKDFKSIPYLIYYDSDESLFKRYTLTTLKEVQEFEKEHLTERMLSEEEKKEYKEGNLQTMLYMFEIQKSLGYM